MRESFLGLIILGSSELMGNDGSKRGMRPGRIQLAQTVVDNAHRWLDDHQVSDKPEWPAPFKDWQASERALSELLRFVTMTAKRNNKLEIPVEWDGRLETMPRSMRAFGYL